MRALEKRKPIWRRWLVPASAGIATLVAVGIGAVPKNRDAEPVTQSKSAVSPTPPSIVVTSGDLDDIVKTRFVPAPDGRGVMGSRWMEITVSAPSTSDGGSVHAEWEAFMLQAATAERLLPPDNLRQAVAGSTILVKRSDGQIEEVPGGSTDAPSGVKFSPAIDGAALAGRVSAAARGARLNVNRLEVLHPLGVALDLAVTTEDPTFGENEFQEFLREATTGLADLEGLYAEVRDKQGNVLRMVGDVNRGHVGLSWAHPSFKGGERDILPNVSSLIENDR